MIPTATPIAAGADGEIHLQFHEIDFDDILGEDAFWFDAASALCSGLFLEVGQAGPDTSADLSITKTDAPDPVLAGNNLIYTVTVNNAGPNTATNVVVTDNLSADVSLVATSGCAEDPVGITDCSLGDILAGDSAHVHHRGQCEFRRARPDQQHGQRDL